MLNAKLVVVGGDAKKAEVQLKLPTVIGRGKEAGLTVPHALVSRRHTEIFEREGRLFVRDLGSLNGTYVNNTRIENDQPLEPNQLLTLGNITFRAVYEIETHDTACVLSTAETVSIDEIKTLRGVDVNDVIEIQTPDGKEQVSSISDVVSFDETVPVDMISSENQPVDSLKPDSVPETGREFVEHVAPAKWADPANHRNGPDFLDDDEGGNFTAGDTDKSFLDRTTSDGSAIGISGFSLELGEADSASKSVSASALDELPVGRPAASSVGSIDTGEDVKKSVSQIDPDAIDLGVEEKKARIEADSRLGSFLKKLPR